MDLVFVMAVGAAAFVLAGAVKGLTGIGLPTVAIGLMTLLLDPRTAIALVLVPMIGSNAWQIFRAGHALRTLRRYGVFAAMLIAAVVLTTLLTKDVSDRILLAVLGIVLLVFVAASWRNLVPPLPPRFDRAAQLGFGTATGIVGALTAGWGAPVAMYLATRRVDKDEFVRATGLLIMIGSIPLAIGYAGLGFLTPALAGASCAMLIPTLLGYTLGEALRARLSAMAFRNALLFVFVCLGINLLRRAIWYG